MESLNMNLMRWNAPSEIMESLTVIKEAINEKDFWNVYRCIGELISIRDSRKGFEEWPIEVQEFFKEYPEVEKVVINFVDLVSVYFPNNKDIGLK